MAESRSRIALASFAQDLRLAARALAKTPASTLLAILTLGLGIGGSTAFFGLLDAAYLRPLPFPETPRLVRLLDAVPTGDGGSYLANLAPKEVELLARRTRAFDRLTWQRFESFALLGAGDPVQVGGASLSPGSAEVLGLAPIVGRVFDAEEEAAGEASGVVIVSRDLWRDKFAADPGVVGKTLSLDGRAVTIVGVAPGSFHFPYRADVWRPMRLDPADGRDLLVIGRLRAGATIAAARAEMSTLVADLDLEIGAAPGGRRLPVHVVSLREELLRDEERTSVGLFLATLLFLVMAAANVAGLLVARASRRRRETAIRVALGASQLDQLRRALAEPILLALAGGALALAVVRLAAPWLEALVPQVLSQELGVEPVQLGWRVGGFALAAALAATLLAGLGPALANLRAGAAAALGAERTARLGGRRRGLRGLVAAEIALLALLLVASAALVAGFVAVSRRPLGLEPRGVWALQVVAPVSRYGEPARLAGLVERIAGEALARPDARVAATTINPLAGGTWGDTVRPAGLAPEMASEVNLRLVSPGLFDALGVALASGRDFAPGDASGAPVAIVSRRLARRLWNRDDVVGETLLRGPALAPVATAVVGVAADVEDAGDLRETIYLPFAQHAATPGANQFWVVARGGAPGGSPSDGWVRELERGLWKIDPQLAWSDAGWLEAQRSDALARDRMGSRLASLYGAFGLLLAGLGLGGIMAFLLAERETEFGLRQALGATPAGLLRALTGEGLALAALGLTAGFAAFFALRPLLAHWVPQVARPAPVVWALVAGLVLAVSALAAFLPARRAARRDPMAALREG